MLLLLLLNKQKLSVFYYSGLGHSILPTKWRLEKMDLGVRIKDCGARRDLRGPSILIQALLSDKETVKCLALGIIQKNITYNYIPYKEHTAIKTKL